ncbi:UvrD-helicase domain-containing protein [Neobacillus sp. PS3-34]|uniref:UvrD-helicase domain-containing protein n=1 Tax=Neobacillus sp. PS3-34 TaxID=3070678 RepID=UPI0027E1C195|nr:UvrD-helicase domain-containing protein [Neobacillus sp. PS3-34]WML50241.1 UvrD-helicase domain-containing protein [Neobacillus sp. PS3-34]
MQFDDVEYELIEKILLGDGRFNSLQREFIELFETKTIVAGPGAGKTTALAAKIVLLLRYLKKIGSKEGVCIITYTNVAINEIHTTLQKAGIASISHPHFIGTLHEFFNRYCVLPFFKKEYNHNTLFFDEESSNDLEFYKKFLMRRYSFMQDGARAFIAEKIQESTLFFDSSRGCIDIENTSGWDKFERYRADALQAKHSRKKQGFLQYDDTFMFSNLFLTNSHYSEMLRNRFKYIFIDEFQDTTPIGIELLRRIFDSENNILQIIGDPYQTIMYGQPMPEIVENQVFKLNLTNRFGKEISKPLNIIMPTVDIQTPEDKVSFAPIILLYEEENQIYTAYKRIIKEYELQSQTFKDNKKSDKVLVWNKRWTPRIKPGITYGNKRSKELETISVQLKRLVIEFVCKKIRNDDESFSELKKWVKNHERIMELNKLLLDFLKLGIADERKQRLKVFINDLLQEKGVARINITNSIFREIDNILNCSDSRGVNGIELTEDDVFTIHSVKGETLRSALLVNFDDGPLTDILFHRYGILSDISYQYTDHNLLYVAISRVTHLFVYALHKDLCTEEVRDKMKVDWIIKGLQGS